MDSMCFLIAWEVNGCGYTLKEEIEEMFCFIVKILSLYFIFKGHYFPALWNSYLKMLKWTYIITAYKIFSVTVIWKHGKKFLPLTQV